jgi:hypothetical protein
MTELNRYTGNQRKHIKSLQQQPLPQFRNLDGEEASWNDCGWIYTDAMGRKGNVYFTLSGDKKILSKVGARKAELLPDDIRLLLMAFTCHIVSTNISMQYKCAQSNKARQWLNIVKKNPARLSNKMVGKSIEGLASVRGLSSFFEWMAEHKLIPPNLALPKGLNKTESRAGHDIIDHRNGKLPDDKVLMALGAIVHDVIPSDEQCWDTHPKTFQREQYVCAMSALAMAAPNRVAAEQTVLHVQKLKSHVQQSKGKDETVYYLDWQGSKGFKNNMNHILGPMAPLADRVLKYMMLVTEPARVLARFYAKPGLTLKRVLGDFKPSQENLDYIKPDLSQGTDIIRLGCLLGFFDGTPRLVRVTKDTPGAFRPDPKRGASVYTKHIYDLVSQDILHVCTVCKYGSALMGVKITNKGIKAIASDTKLTLKDFQNSWIAHIKKQFPAFPYANNSSSGRVDLRLAMFTFTGNQVVKDKPGYTFGKSHFALIPLSSLSTVISNELSKNGSTNNGANIFKNHGFSDAFFMTPHQFRHYIDDAADRGGVAHKIINLWSGRKDPEQLLHYLHRTNAQKASEIQDIMFRDEHTEEKAIESVSLRLKSQQEYALLTDSATAVHSTGICTQNLLLRPCDYLNDFVSQCALCASSCHVAHDIDACSLLKKDLEVQTLRLHHVSKDEKLYRSKNMQSWFKIHHQNTEMLRQLIEVLEDKTIRAGSIVRLISDKNEMRITDLKTKFVEKRAINLPSPEEVLSQILQHEASAEKAKHDEDMSGLLALIEI